MRGSSNPESGCARCLAGLLATKENALAIKLNASVVAVHGEHHLEAITVEERRRRTRRSRSVRRESLFVFIGADAASGSGSPAASPATSGSYLLTRPGRPGVGEVGPGPRPVPAGGSGVPGVFAAGDVRHGSIKRVASGVGEGSMSVAFVHQYLGA